jgi:single-stranded DNA-binding protein
MNSATLSGELSSNPQSRFVNDGQTQVVNAVLQFNNFKGQPERMKIAAWGNQAAELQKYQQGTMLIVEGRYKSLKVERDGFKEDVLELNVSKIHEVNV